MKMTFVAKNGQTLKSRSFWTYEKDHSECHDADVSSHPVHLFYHISPSDAHTRSFSIGNIVGNSPPDLGTFLHSVFPVYKLNLHLIGPLTFTGATAPAYIPAKIAMMTAFAAAEIIVVLLRILLQLENKRRSKNNTLGHVRDSEFMNLTDKENPEFKVCYYYT